MREFFLSILILLSLNIQSQNVSNNFKIGNHELVVNELNHGRPVYMRGGWADYFLGIFDYYGGGHAWVCDGYQKTVYITHSTLYFHMNWGWIGKSNGWFAFNNFNPTYGGDQYTFNYRTGCVIGIHP